MNSFPEDLIPIGKILKPYGIKGQIKFKPYNENSDLLIQNSVVWLKHENDQSLDFKFFKISSINYNSLFQIIKFNEINNRDKASEFSDCIVYVSRSILPDYKDQIYFVDFIGCRIYDNNKSFIGTVKDIVHFKGDNHNMIIQNGSKEFMIPVRNDLIKLFDIDEKYIIIEIIDGLIDNV